MELPYAVILISLVALLFDFPNGMNDAANSIATVVATHVLPPRLAVAWAAFFNFAAVFIFGTAIAKTIGRGIVVPGVVDNPFVLSALVGAVAWVWLCTHCGLPISVSHALIGGMVGAAMMKGGWAAVIWWPGVGKIAIFIVLSPLIGGVLGYALMCLSTVCSYRGSFGQMTTLFRGLQLASTAFFSLGHGSNDAQKVAGLITALLVANNYLETGDEVPYWVLFTCYVVIGLGTLIGGWRVIRTLGVKMTRLKPMGGFSAETGGALTLVMASQFGIPISTTHTITGAIMGVGTTNRLSAVRWGVAANIIIAWATTIPACALASALALWLLQALDLPFLAGRAP
ncbi:MAG: inorganic phosphate transporter [Verrucomicrobia bacterium]|nr:inorganic phosphate transporter [Verrucomicrobiota bacterium]